MTVPAVETPALKIVQEAGEFRNEPPTDYSRPEAQARLMAEFDRVKAEFPHHIPLVIGGKRIDTEEMMNSVDPSEFKRVVAVACCADEAHVDQAVKSARQTYQSWSQTPQEERSALLMRAAAILREKKQYLSAIELFEAGKPGLQAIADLDEAIDFIEYYAREAWHLSKPRHMQPYLQGEKNTYGYYPLGVVGVIGPWNFPGAIPIGMSSAALVTGNTVLLKPAEQTPLIAWLYIQALEEAGLPPGAINFIPGRGEVAGAAMVRHAGVNMIVFTGSRDVGLMITREAAQVREGQHFVKRIVTEMGGKNGLIVDSSADIDRSVADTLYSAYGFSGQKCSACSRLILMADIYDEYMTKLRAEAAKCAVGPAEKPDTLIGPVIDDEAQQKVLKYIQIGKESARTAFLGDVSELAQHGFFVPPAIFEVDSPDHSLMQEEIFGPVLTVIKVRDFDEALKVANSTPYALTGGVHSANRDHLDRASREFAAGNLYFNRSITGAIVERQPFGGFRLSGIGSKTGGPDYLKQFLVARAITEKL